MRGERETQILTCSSRMFLQKGYTDTTMRQIAAAAGVSLGLATYHFQTKRQIAVLVMEAYLRYLRERVDTDLPAEAGPLVHSAAMVRLSIEFWLEPARRRFYLECLANDIHTESIQRLGVRAMSDIARAYRMELSSDLILLFDNYIPPNVEKILLLEKERGNFPGISYDEVPDIVFSVSVERHFSRTEIARAAAAARPIARAILESVPDPVDFLLFE